MMLKVKVLLVRLATGRRLVTQGRALDSVEQLSSSC